MQFRSIGFIPTFVTIVVGALFVLKFQRESAQAEYAIELQSLIDESGEGGGPDSWETRRKNFYGALVLLSEAQVEKVDLERLIEKAAKKMEVPAAYERALSDSLLLNLRIAEELALLNEENMERLANGEELVIGAGGFAGEVVVIGNMIPNRYSPEIETLFANLLLRPEREMRRHPDRFGVGAEVMISALRSAEIMSEMSYERSMRAVR